MNIFSRSRIALFLVLVFILGAAYIVYQNRPVKQLENSDFQLPDRSGLNFEELNSESKGITSRLLRFTPEEIARHSEPNDCWAIINESVYDLTSWIERHPGGAKPIRELCGQDGSAMFNNQHGSSQAPQEALILLKIGNLEE